MDYQGWDQACQEPGPGPDPGPQAASNFGVVTGSLSVAGPPGWPAPRVRPLVL